MEPDKAQQYHRRENPERERIEADVQAFLDAGGKIDYVPPGVGADQYQDSWAHHDAEKGSLERARQNGGKSSQKTRRIDQNSQRWVEGRIPRYSGE